jgi:hypothetical protein
MREMNKKGLKKDRERWQLERFKISCLDFPVGTITPAEEPDFLIGGGSGVVGVELTALYRADSEDQLPRQASEALREEIVKRAQRLYQEGPGPELWVSVHFSPYATLRKSLVAGLAAKLATIVTAANVGINGNVELEDDSDAPGFPQEFSTVNIRRLQVLTKGFWTSPDAAFVPDCEPKEIQQIIDKKNKRVPSYLRKCQTIWLVVVFDGFALSSTVNLPDEIPKYVYKSGFDRTFIFENAAARSFELKTT